MNYFKYFLFCFLLINISQNVHGQSLISVGGGVTSYGFIYAMQYDSANNRLYTGGYFRSVNGLVVSNIAMWDGMNWSSLGQGLDGPVWAMKFVGTDLYVGGNFHHAGGTSVNNVAKWDGTSWSSPAQGLPYTVTQMEYFQNKLYVTGYSTSYFLASYDGTTWSQNIGTFDYNINGLSVIHSRLVVYGDFTSFNSNAVNGLIQYDGSSWYYFPAAGGAGSGITSLATYQDSIYVICANELKHWTGSAWDSDYTVSTFTIDKLITYNNDLYVVRDDGFNPDQYFYVKKYQNGNLTTPLFQLHNTYQNYQQSIYATVSSGNKFFAGGAFDDFDDTLALNLVYYSGTSWSNRGSFSSDCFVDPWQVCLNTTLLKDSVTGDVYAGGVFFFAGLQRATNVARWDGNSWHEMGKGLNNRVRKLIRYNGDIYAVGNFTKSHTTQLNYIARWNGTSWVPVGNGANAQLDDAVVFNNELYVSGDFTMMDGVSANYVAKYNGSAWSAVGNNVLDDRTLKLCVYNGKLIAGSENSYYWGSPTAAFDTISHTWQTLGTTSTNGVESLLNLNGELYYSAEAFQSYNVFHWNGNDWILMANVGNTFSRSILFDFRGQLAVSIVNEGFFLYDGSTFNQVSQIQPYAIVQKDSNNYYVGGYIPTISFGMNQETINDIGTLNFSMPQVSFTVNTDTICERQYIYFNVMTTDAFAQFHWYFPGGSPDSLDVPNPIVQYVNPGTFNPYLVVSNLAGSDTVYLSPPIVVLPCIFDQVEEVPGISLKVFPNPFSSELYINSSEHVRAVTIQDLEGKIILKVEDFLNTRLDLHDISTGLYILKCTTDHSTQIFKVFKQ